MGGGPVGATVQQTVNYKAIPNNTRDKWWQDPDDGSLFNGLQTIDGWQKFFGHPTGNTLGLMNSAALFPGLVTPLVAERIASRYGRRWAVWVGIWINVVGVVINSASVNLGMYIAGRAVMGCGISMGLTIAPTLLQEIAHPRYRAPLGTLYTSIYYSAAVISAAVCLGTRNIAGDASWRIPCYLQLVGPIVTFAITVTMPESPRWLIQKERNQEALEILARFHANGERDDPLVVLEYNEIVEGIRSEVMNSQVSYFDYFKPANRHRLLLLVVIAIGTNWVGNGIISYYLAPILSQIGVTSTYQQAGLNLGLQIWNLILSTTAGLNCDRIGRRPLWLTSNIGMLCTFVVIMGLSGAYAENGVKAVGLAVIPFLFIFFGFYDISWTPLANMYSVEILPYSLRAKGQAIFNIVQGSANAVNQWVNPIILEAITWKYYAVYIGILTAYVFIIWRWFPETKNLTMEEIALVFDNERAAGVRDVAQGAKAKMGVDDAAADHVEETSRS